MGVFFLQVLELIHTLRMLICCCRHRAGLAAAVLQAGLAELVRRCWEFSQFLGFSTIFWDRIPKTHKSVEILTFGTKIGMSALKQGPDCKNAIF